MAENDFYQINGNSYRGSRYSNFVGGGVDTQGNVSSAAVENQTNNQEATPSQNTPQISSEVREVSNRGVDLGPSQNKYEAPATLTESATKMAIGATVPAAATTIGSAVGANIAAGAPATSGIGQAISDRISAGLLGSSASSTATNAALASMGGKFGPATQASVSKASSGLSAGGAVGSGLGTAAATLLTGGSVKDAAFQGAGAAIGTYFGGPIGGFIGSTIGSFVGKVFGGGTPRVTIGGNLNPDESGKLTVGKLGNKGASNSASNTYVSAIGDILNNFGQATGIKYTGNLYTETNIGKKDKKTVVGKSVVSRTAGDVGGAALSYLKNTGNYTLGDDAEFNSFWESALKTATDINSLGSQVDNFYSSRSAAVSPTVAAQNNIKRRQGDKFATFYG